MGLEKFVFSDSPDLDEVCKKWSDYGHALVFELSQRIHERKAGETAKNAGQSANVLHLNQNVGFKGGKGGKGGKAPTAKKTPTSRSSRAGLQVPHSNNVVRNLY